jgi:RNA polymerase sigma-70 factor (ECF subfamily)
MPIIINKGILRKLSSGDEKAFRRIYDTYKSKLYFYALKFTKNEYAAEEIVQQVFIKLWDTKHVIDPALSFDAYLFRITRNTTFNFLKMQARESLHKQAFMADTTQKDHQTEETLDYYACEALAIEAIEALPEKRQIIFKMSHDEGLNAEEIAEMLKISVNTVKSQLVKASKTIKAHLLQHANILLLFFILAWLAKL